MKPVVALVWGLSTLFWCLGFSAVGALAEPSPAGPALKAIRVYFGTYTGAKSRGIYLSSFDPRTGSLSTPVLAAEGLCLRV